MSSFDFRLDLPELLSKWNGSFSKEFKQVVDLDRSPGLTCERAVVLTISIVDAANNILDKLGTLSREGVLFSFSLSMPSS